MIRRIEGKIVEKNPDYCVIMTGGIGYIVNVSKDVSLELPQENETVMLYTYLMVKEDALMLYGFTQPDKLAVFELVLNVSGIGPRIALELLSTLTPKSFYLAILNDDENKLTKISGIGNKSAKRIILELKERVKGLDFFEVSKEAGSLPDETEDETQIYTTRGILDEAINALSSLGYSEVEANRVLSKIKPEITPDMDLEKVLKKALKSLQNG